MTASYRPTEARWHFWETYAPLAPAPPSVPSAIAAVVIEALAQHKDDYGSTPCPRPYPDKKIDIFQSLIGISSSHPRLLQI